MPFNRVRIIAPQEVEQSSLKYNIALEILSNQTDVVRACYRTIQYHIRVWYNNTAYMVIPYITTVIPYYMVTIPYGNNTIW